MEIFDPVKYSLEENKFFLAHLGESPVAALQDTLPTGVAPVVVEEVLGAVYELEELAKHRGQTWAGIAAVTSAIQTYLSESTKWGELSAKGAPRFPTMHAWDGKGRPHRGGITSDAGQVHTYIDAQGERQRLAIPLQGSPLETFHPDWVKPEEPLPDTYIVDEEQGILTCPVDGWSTNFKAESRSSFNVARARMSRHCKSSKDDRVREFGEKVFG
jgi:hypothetical protein